MPARRLHRAGGRPPKFDEPRRPITVTLPERTLGKLAAIHADRALAIVKAVDSKLGGGRASVRRDGGRLVDVVEVAPGSSVILVRSSRCLRRIPWLRLAEVASGRYLLTIPPGTPIESLEVAIRDLLDTLPVREIYERRILRQLSQLLRVSRRRRTITKFEMLYLRSAERRRPSSKGKMVPQGIESRFAT